MVINGSSTANKDFKIAKCMPNWSGLVGKLMNTGIQNLTILNWYGFMI
jgi:hypothetical protein